MPHFLLPSVFRLPWSIIFEKEGENDGLVSVESAMWGNYKVGFDEIEALGLVTNVYTYCQATLENVNHLDLECFPHCTPSILQDR